MQTYWFLALMASICLEGLGRKYLPAVPSIAFYLLKDFVLLFGQKVREVQLRDILRAIDAATHDAHIERIVIEPDEDNALP